MYKSKLTVTLFTATIVASFVALPEAGFGVERLLQQQKEQREREAALAGKKTALKTQRGAIADPAAALAAASPLTAALVAASADPASAAHGMAHGTDAQKLELMAHLEAHPNPTDATHRSAIRTALGINPDPAQFAPGDKLEKFIVAAEEKLVRLPDKTAKAKARKADVAARDASIVDLTKHRDALANPAGALAAASPLTAALAAASADAGSAANGMAHGTEAEKIAAMRAVEGGGAADDAHKTAIRTALGIDPKVANFAATNAAVTEFITAAEHRVGGVPLLAHIPGADLNAKLAAVLARIDAGTHKANDGTAVAAAPSADIHAALTRLGL